MSETKLIKDKECIHCKRLFNCDGKPRENALCLHFKERENGRSEVDKDNYRHL